MNSKIAQVGYTKAMQPMKPLPLVPQVYFKNRWRKKTERELANPGLLKSGIN